MQVRTRPLYWPAPATGSVDAIVADWNLVLAGIRKDIARGDFNRGVTTDSTGKVIRNLLHEDKVAVRERQTRAGYYLANPNRLDTNVATRQRPVGLVKNSGTSSVPRRGTVLP